MYTAGVDIGGTSIKFGVVDERYEFVYSEMFPPAYGDPEATADRIVTAMRECPVPINRVGVGTAGLVETNEQLVSAVNIGWRRAPLKAMLKSRTGLPVWVDNDAQAALAAEWQDGVLEGCDTAVLLTLGTGVGGALLIGGKPWRGTRNNASELGHIVTHADGLPCPCGSRGCFERYASATALSQMAGGASAKAVADGARAGDPEMREIFTRYLRELAAGVVSLTWVFQPEVIALGGGVSRAGDILLDGLNDILHADYGREGDTHIRLARHQNNAGMLGAAALAAYHLG